MNTNPLLGLKALGQHVWLDNLSRSLLREGGLQRLINEDGVDGVTSNPAIFAKALADSPYYAEDLEGLRSKGLGAEACYEALVIADIRAACAMLQPVFTSSQGEAGYVSLEVSPVLADDMGGTVAAAHRLSRAVGRDNLLIKVPATPAGLKAFEQLTADGIKVNVTLIFSLSQYEATLQAYLSGARRWLSEGGSAGRLRSVASVFISRIDSLVDQRLADGAGMGAEMLLGKTGIALARLCYQRYLEVFHGADFAALGQAGVRPQTPLWASTGSKNPAYGDVLYVEALIGPASINTMPELTLAAFRDHGRVSLSLASDADAAARHVGALAGLGIDLNQLGQTLQEDGVRLFVEAYQKILNGLG